MHTDGERGMAQRQNYADDDEVRGRTWS